MGIEDMEDFEELEGQDRLEDTSEFEHSLENSQGLETLDETHIRQTEKLEEGDVYKRQEIICQFSTIFRGQFRISASYQPHF